MAIKMHNYNKFPKDLEYLCGDIEPLDEYDIRYIEDFDEAWYFYAAASYEGMGGMILRKGGEYCYLDLGHCSCYGPTEENFESLRKFSSLDELGESCSEDALRCGIGELIEYARSTDNG